jgi:hypothetical protein
MLSKEEDYAWTRPALMQWKMRELELKAGSTSRRGGNKAGPARDYSLKGTSNNTLLWLSERLRRSCQGGPPIGTALTPSWPFARHTDATRERAQAGAGAIRSS